MSTQAQTGPCVLVIRDGWGENPHVQHDAFNAVAVARQRGLTPVDDRLRRDWPWTYIKTGGLDVGVPADQTGNSEVGHQNIGAGRIVDQEVVRISKACDSDAIAQNDAVKGAILAAKASGKRLHLMGIASDAGVHGLLSHLYALLRACKAHGMAPDRVCVHLFTDGRDTPPQSGRGFVQQVQQTIASLGIGRIVTLAGRYYAMDRDFRWERVKMAYDVLTGRDGGQALRFATADDAIGAFYAAPTSSSMSGDEFVTPRTIGASAADVQASRISDGDSVIFYNYRGDRPRELAMAFVMDDAAWAGVKPSPDSGVRGFDRGARLRTHFVAMTAWSEDLAPLMHVAFAKPPKMPLTAGEVWSKAGLRQLRVAETEKFPHVTFFFNDYREQPFPGETRVNPPSPKVSTYDQAPAMSAVAVRDAVLAALADTSDASPHVIVVNFANPDMVGHTGNLDAAVQAVATTDACVGAIIEATLARGGQLIVTADHGNCEQMFDPESNSPHTAHTPYDVPLFVVSPKHQGRTLRGDRQRDGFLFEPVRVGRGRLADVVPTMLALMGMPQPPEMTGRSLLA
jgi:2,3-bisphosphoglycerate-independent phosphoglycerate mutase